MRPQGLLLCALKAYSYAPLRPTPILKAYSYAPLSLLRCALQAYSYAPLSLLLCALQAYSYAPLSLLCALKPTPMSGLSVRTQIGIHNTIMCLPSYICNYIYVGRFTA
jgi:hypothetical protein